MKLARMSCAFSFFALLPMAIPHPAQDLANDEIDRTALNIFAGFAGEKLGSTYKLTVGRRDLHLAEMGATINIRTGLNSLAAFAGNDGMPKSPAASPCARAKSTRC